MRRDQVRSNCLPRVKLRQKFTHSCTGYLDRRHASVRTSAKVGWSRGLLPENAGILRVQYAGLTFGSTVKMTFLVSERWNAYLIFALSLDCFPKSFRWFMCFLVFEQRVDVVVVGGLVGVLVISLFVLYLGFGFLGSLVK